MTADVWRMVGQFDTLEDAEGVVNKLKFTGVDVEVTLIGGLSVIARSRSVVPHITRCQPAKRAPVHSWAHYRTPLTLASPSLPDSPQTSEDELAADELTRPGHLIRELTHPSFDVG